MNIDDIHMKTLFKTMESVSNEMGPFAVSMNITNMGERVYVSMHFALY